MFLLPLASCLLLSSHHSSFPSSISRLPSSLLRYNPKVSPVGKMMSRDRDRRTPAMRVVLDVVEGPESGRVFVFEQADTFLIGRSSKAHLQLDARADQFISRAHCVASTTEENSSSSPSPMLLTMRPLCAAIVGSTNSALCARRAASVPDSSEPISRE